MRGLFGAGAVDFDEFVTGSQEEGGGDGVVALVEGFGGDFEAFLGASDGDLDFSVFAVGVVVGQSVVGEVGGGGFAAPVLGESEEEGRGIKVDAVGGGEFWLERRDARGAEEEGGLGAFCLEDVFAGGHPGASGGIEPWVFTGKDEAARFGFLFDDGGLEDVGANEELIVDFIEVFAGEVVEQRAEEWRSGSFVGDEEVVEIRQELIAKPDIVGDVIPGGGGVCKWFLGFCAVVAVIAGEGEEEVGLHPALHESGGGISAESTDVGTIEDVTGEVHAEAGGDAEFEIEIVGDIVTCPDGGIARGSGESGS